MFTLHNFDDEGFLSRYWQKQPVVIRNVFPHFNDLLDEHELAGLAMEPELDSRIISRNGEHWSHNAGPFESFDAVLNGHWTLLVQGIDRVLPEANALMSAFSMIPDWRRDDLMVSFAVEGAGVGPHLDQYDVFIIQGKGKRHWRVGARGEYQEHRPHPKLSQVAPFDAILDEVLEPGDLIYIPPGCPHDGVALEPCINYSVGFRAPSQAELISQFADYLLDKGAGSTRYADPGLAPRALSAEINRQEIETFRQLMHQLIDSDHFDRWLPEFLSEAPLASSTEAQSSDVWTIDEIRQALAEGQVFEKRLDLRWLLINRASDTITLYINGTPHPIDKQILEAVERLLASQSWPPSEKINYENSLFFEQFFTTLVNSGYWNPEND